MTPAKKKLISEAIKIWNKLHGQRGYKKKFMAKMIDNGWKYDDWGAYKEVLYKGSIVVKFNRLEKDYRNEVFLEYEQYNTATRELKKHLAHIHGLFDGLLIQDKVNKNFDDREYLKLYKKVNKLEKKYGLEDTSQNFGLSRSGIIKFHDLVLKKLS